MNELHPQARAFRSPPTEMNLAKQSYPEFDDSDQAQTQGEANVVEMPQRQSHDAFAVNPTEPSQTPRSTSQRKQGVDKPKPAASQKAFPFRQLRDGHQQPYIDEQKRLEAQAERINQLVADRKRKQVRAEQTAERTTEKLPATTERVPKSVPKKKTPKSVRQPSNPTARSPQREVSPMSAHHDDTDVLEAQAARTKPLLQAPESASEGVALPHNGAIAHSQKPHSFEDRSQAGNPAPASPITTSSVEAFAPTTYRYGTDTVPFGVNQTQATAGVADQQAQQEATETAQALRYLASREQVESTIAAPQSASRRHSGRSHEPYASSSPPSMRRYGLRLRQLLQIPHKSLDRFGDAVLWIVLAAAVRVGARIIVAQFPVLAPILLVLMLAPAAVAVYLAIGVPKAGFVSFYRLFLIMLGLLLGGRF